MSTKSTIGSKTLSTGIATALGAAFSLNVAAAPMADAANPFQLTDLGSGYMVAAEGKCGSKAKSEQEAKCGSNAEKKSEEGACGAKSKDAEGKCAANKVEEPMPKSKEGKCGEGKCGSKG